MSDHKTLLVAASSAAAFLLVAGCAASGGNLRDFNAEFHEQHPVDPQYSIRELGPRSGEITLHQGAILISPTSVRHRHIEEAGERAIAAPCATATETERSVAFEWNGPRGTFNVTGTLP